MVSCDISVEMIKMFKKKFEDPLADYTVIPGNKVIVKEEEFAPLGDQSWDLEQHLKEMRYQENERAVFGGVANNESLPFKSDTFDCYIANLSLMLVDNHSN